MKANRWLFSFLFTALVFLTLVCTNGVQREPYTVAKGCDINRHIKHLRTKWESNNWSNETSNRCIGHILLEWAYQMKEALHGNTTIEKDTYLDGDGSNLGSNCNPFLRRRTNRSSLDALQDVFSLLLELATVLKGVDWCPLITTHCRDTYYNRTRSLVRTMNCLVRHQNGLNASNQTNHVTEPLCWSR